MPISIARDFRANTFTATRENGTRKTYDLNRDDAVADRLAELDRVRNSGSGFTRQHAEEIGDLKAFQAERQRERERLERAAANPDAGESAETTEQRAAELSGAEIRNGVQTSTPKSAAGRAVDQARRIVDQLHGRDALASAPAEAVERMLERPGNEAGEAARWVAVAGDETYLAAFSKHLADPTNGHLDWTPAEAAAWREARSFSNAIGTTGGSPMLPLILDPAILLTNDGSIGGIRSVARQVQITGASWNGVTSAGATAEWKVEHAQAADGTPSVDGVEIPVHLLDVDALVSYELAADAVNFASELARVLTDAATMKVDAALVAGTGTGQPTGIVTAVSAVTSTSLTVGTSGAFGSTSVVALQNALPARFQPRASFVAALPVINAMGSMETSNGALRFPDVDNGRLLRRALVEDSNVSSDMTTTGSKPLIYGDFFNYVMVNRVGSTIEVLPNFGANGRPTAERHYFLTLRMGADATVPGAFRLLNKN